MKGTGTVKAIHGEYIEVVAPRESQCSSCALKNECSNNSLKEGQTVWVKNTIDAKIGDYVEFEFSEKDLNRGLFIVYGIPMIFIVVGAVIGSILEFGYNIKISNLKDFTIFITTLVSLSIGIFIVRLADRYVKPYSYTTKIISREIIKPLM
ncbi:SoxR reducing system RseC family protein [Caldisericum sp. AR60]|uniref:SoxR reducing system RseC family protein n=1 Tax=Caldisericum sp. AR60 TaxID=3397852 RepID=UPI0039FCDBD1